jgi:hypothetical protein
MNQEELFQCPECGLHYRDKTTANECEAFCKVHKACNLVISMKSVEHEEAMRKARDES